MFVLDTDTYSHYLLQHPKVVEGVMQAVARGDSIAVTIITKIELLQGRMSALLKADNQERFLTAQQRLLLTEEALQQIPILLLDEQALEHFETLSKTRGLKKIGRADLLIASMVRAHQRTLVTRNQKHFQKVPDLQLVNWVD